MAVSPAPPSATPAPAVGAPPWPERGRPAIPWSVHVQRAAALAIVLLATALRLVRLDFAQWRNDEEIIWLHALRALTAGQVPWQGIPSDLGIANGPGELLPVLPAAALGSPYVAYVLVALLNVLAVAALIRLGRLIWGPGLGLAAGLLCAVAPWDVIHSRRLWGNDMLAPFAVLFVTALWQVAARRHERRLVAALGWLALLLQMYIAALVQLAVLAVGLGLAAARYGRRDVRGLVRPLLAGAALFAVLFAGYALTTFLPHAADLAHAVRDTRPETPNPVGLPNWEAFPLLWQSVGGDGYQYYLQHAAQRADVTLGQGGAGSALARLLFLAGLAALLRELRHLLPGRRPADGPARGVGAALVLTWLVALPAALVVHDAPVCACYLLPSYPAQYLVVALGAFGLGQVLVASAPWRWRAPARRRWGAADGQSGQVLHTAAALMRRADQAAVPAHACGHPSPDLRPPPPAGEGWRSQGEGPRPASAASGQAPPRFLARVALPWVLVGAVAATQAGAVVPFLAGSEQYWPADRYGLPYAWHGRIVEAVRQSWWPGEAVVVAGHGELDGVLRDEIETGLPGSAPRLVDDGAWLSTPGPDGPAMVVLLTPGGSPAHGALEQLVAARPAVERADVIVPGEGLHFRVLVLAPADAAWLDSALAPAAADHPVVARFGQEVRLERLVLPNRLLPGQQTAVRLEWTVLRTRPVIPADSYFVHLVGAGGTTAALDAPFLPPGLWQQGERVWTFGTLRDPGGDDPRRDVQMGLYVLRGKDGSAGVRPVPAVDSAGQAEDALHLGPVVVQAARPGGPAQGSVLAPGLDLVGADLPANARAGTGLPVALHWQAAAALPRYTVFIHLLDAGGVLRAQQDGEPQGGRLPTLAWLPGERVDDRHSVLLPAGLAAGRYTVVIGVYPTGRPDQPHALTLPGNVTVEAGPLS